MNTKLFRKYMYILLKLVTKMSIWPKSHGCFATYSYKRIKISDINLIPGHTRPVQIRRDDKRGRQQTIVRKK